MRCHARALHGATWSRTENTILDGWTLGSAFENVATTFCEWLCATALETSSFLGRSLAAMIPRKAMWTYWWMSPAKLLRGFREVWSLISKIYSEDPCKSCFGAL